MEPMLLLVAIVVIMALIFDFSNGFHDAGNAIATVVATKVLTPRSAVIYGAVLNFGGAMMGTEVAATIGKGIVDQQSVTIFTVMSCLFSAIVWNFFTWYKGLPTSSTHALIGSLIGATVFSHSEGTKHVHFDALLNKVVWPMFSSPMIGFLLGFMLMAGLAWMFYRQNVNTVNRYFSKLQIVSAGLMALSHGSNDAQKSMGIIALALVMLHPEAKFEIPMWVILSCAAAMGLGTLFGGWRIIRTLGSKLIKLQPVHGFAAEATSACLILGASHIGIPVSTTQVVTSSIMGVGATKRMGAVRWNVVSNIMWAWLLTLPATFVLSATITYIVHLFV